MKTATKSDWQTKEYPLNRNTVSLNRMFSLDEIHRMRLGLVPEEMEEKWFIYWQEDRLFFHRSWTGFCIYIVRFVAEGDSYRMVEADLNREPAQYSEANDDRDANMISYLIDVLLLQREAAFPIEEPDSERKTLMEWSQVGRAMLGHRPKHE